MKKWIILGSIAFYATFFLLQKCSGGTPNSPPPVNTIHQGEIFDSVDKMNDYLDSEIEEVE